MKNTIRLRLSSDKASFLGLKIRPKEGKRNPRYTITEKQQLLLDNYIKHDKAKELFYDIETSPALAFTWGAGWKMNIPYDNIVEDWQIICISYKWNYEDEVKHLYWENDGNVRSDEKLVYEFVQILNQADVIIAHNGDRFDEKKIRTRAVFHGIPMRAKYKSYDTLKKVKQVFRFDSNKLDSIAKFLNVGAKYVHSGFSLWTDVFKGDKKALDEMLEYCDQDVIVLEDVYNAIKHYTQPITHYGTLEGNSKHSCPKCGMEAEELVLLKNFTTPTGTIRRLVKSKSCNHEYILSNRTYMQYWEKRILSK